MISLPSIFNNKKTVSDNLMQKSISLLLSDSIHQSQEDIKQILHKNFEEVFSKHPTLTPDKAYYLEACKLHILNLKMTNQVHKIEEQLEGLRYKLRREGGQAKLVQSHRITQKSQDKSSDHKKRLRRTAVEIARHYVCKIEYCGKSYGSQGSLNQHIKLKHQSHYTKHLLLGIHQNKLIE